MSVYVYFYHNGIKKNQNYILIFYHLTIFIATFEINNVFS